MAKNNKRGESCNTLRRAIHNFLDQTAEPLDAIDKELIKIKKDIARM